MVKASTWFAIAWFIFWIIAMVLAQIWSDSIPDYPKKCQNIHDIIHDLVPRIEFVAITDIWVITYIVIFFIWVIFFPPKRRGRERLIRIFFFLWGIIYGLRAIFLTLNRYPKTGLGGENSHPKHIFWGVLGGIVGTNPTVTDLFFSGHTATIFLVAQFVGYYTNHSTWSSVLWFFAPVGGFFIMATQLHYTVDVLAGSFFADWIFHRYHSVMDPGYLLAWRPGVRLTNLPSGVSLPATLRDNDGRVIKLVSRKKGKKRLHPRKFFNRARYQLWKYMRRFDGE